MEFKVLDKYYPIGISREGVVKNMITVGSASYILGIRSLSKVSKPLLESIGYILNYIRPVVEKEEYNYTIENMIINRNKYRSKPYVQKLYKVAAIDLLSDNKAVLYFNEKIKFIDYINKTHNIQDNLARFCSFQKLRDKQLLLYRGYIIQTYNNISELLPWTSEYNMEEAYNSRYGRSVHSMVFKDNKNNIFLSMYYVIRHYEDILLDKSILETSLSAITDKIITEALDPNYNIVITRLNSITIKI